MTVAVNGTANGVANGFAKPAVALPAEAPIAWEKPVGSSSTYKPTHPTQFRVVFKESAEPGVESFSSKLIAEKVSLSLCVVGGRNGRVHLGAKHVFCALLGPLTRHCVLRTQRAAPRAFAR